MNAEKRVGTLRALMEKHSIDAYVIPSEDAHMSEYVAACDERRAFMTSFTGSAGTALVTRDAAYCWTDGRYFVQAGKELDASVFKLMKAQEDPPIEEWIAANLPETAVVGVDGRTVSVAVMKRFRNALASASARMVTLMCMPPDAPNLVDLVWATARPALPASTVFVHPVTYAGQSVASKLQDLRTHMREHEASVLVVTGLDQVAWLLNLRGSDVEFNPVFWAYVMVTADVATLYVNSTRFAKDVDTHLTENQVSVRPYEALYADLAAFAWSDDAKLWVDPVFCNYSIVDCVEKAHAGVSVIRKQSPISLAKAKKNQVELDGMRSCHVRDGVALCKFLCWLETRVCDTSLPAIDECDAADKLDGLRSEQDLFVSLSFPTISSSGSNGGVIHYRPEKKTCAKVSANEMYLVDSGGQYRDGTTDVTRTVHFGNASQWQRECFTRVLQGHIAIDSSVFPKGTTGHVLDAFARRALWNVGLDFKHGTGHGVGSFLNVHEGPHVISFKAQALETALADGFLTSNEPGYYEEDGFGIRIETVCIIKPADVPGVPGRGSERPFLCLEHVTLAPIQTKLIDVSLLTTWERDWVNRYHDECLEKLGPKLQDDPVTLAWLKKNTQPLAAE